MNEISSAAATIQPMPYATTGQTETNEKPETIEQAEWRAAQRLGAQLPPQGWQTPNLEGANVQNTSQVRGVDAVLVTLKGENNPYLVLQSQHKDPYAALRRYQDGQGFVKDSNDRGYKTVKSEQDVPAYRDYVRFGRPDEGADTLRFEYKKDGRVEKGIVSKHLTPQLFDRIAADHQKFDKANQWSRTNRVPIAGADYRPPLISHLEKAERVDGLGQDAIRVKAAGKEELVLKGMVGNQAFNQLQSYVDHNDIKKKMEAAGASIWDKKTFDTTKFQLAGTVAGIYSGMERNGFLVVRFNNEVEKVGSHHKNQTVVFSEKDSPEAFAVIRKFAKNGDDSFPGTSPLDNDKPRALTAKDLDVFGGSVELKNGALVGKPGKWVDLEKSLQG